MLSGERGGGGGEGKEGRKSIVIGLFNALQMDLRGLGYHVTPAGIFILAACTWCLCKIEETSPIIRHFQTFHLSSAYCRCLPRCILHRIFTFPNAGVSSEGVYGLSKDSKIPSCETHGPCEPEVPAFLLYVFPHGRLRWPRTCLSIILLSFHPSIHPPIQSRPVYLPLLPMEYVNQRLAQEGARGTADM